jgi:GNAT superfamily N-acetyltransferase
MSASFPVPLRDGRIVRLRRAVAADVPSIVRLWEGLSKESERMRFAGARPASALLLRFAAVAGPQRAGVVVATEGEGPTRADRDSGRADLLGEARYLPQGGSAAELAVTVRDDHQGRGLGRLLLAALVEQARTEGVDRLRAEVLVDNAPMLALLGEYGWVLTDATRERVVHLEISTRGGVPGWDQRVVGRRRVLVEGGSFYDDPVAARRRAAGDDVRRCLGPRRDTWPTCPLLTEQGCRLAEGADVIISSLRPDDPQSSEILRAHGRRWPERLDRELDDDSVARCPATGGRAPAHPRSIS